MKSLFSTSSCRPQLQEQVSSVIDHRYGSKLFIFLFERKPSCCDVSSSSYPQFLCSFDGKVTADLPDELGRTSLHSLQRECSLEMIESSFSVPWKKWKVCSWCVRRWIVAHLVVKQHPPIALEVLHQDQYQDPRQQIPCTASVRLL